VTNAGSAGPSAMFLTPRYSNVSRTATAFCSNHEMTSVSGRSVHTDRNA
jgi:hypothetical protein